MGMEPANEYSALKGRIDAARRQKFFSSLSARALTSLSGVALSASAMVVAEALGEFGPEVRTAMVASLVAGGVAAFAAYVAPPVYRFVRTRAAQAFGDTAREIGEAFPELRDRLLNALQLYDVAVAGGGGASSELAMASFRHVARSAAPLDFSVIVDKRRRKRALILFAAALGLAAVPFAVAPSQSAEAAYRLVNFSRAFYPPAPFSLSIEPGEEVSLLRGESARVRVTVAGSGASDIFLRLREEGQQEYDSFRLRPDSSGVAVFELPALKRSVEFYAESPWYADAVRSDTGAIAVVDKPDLRALNGRIVPPSYTRAAPREFDQNGADIIALKGSAVQISGVASKDLRSAEVVMWAPRADSLAADTSVVPLAVAGRKLSGSFAVRSAGQYYVRITDERGQVNANPIISSIVAQDDASPTISLIEPTRDAEVGEEAILPIKVLVADDYGFSRLRVMYRLAASRYVMPDKDFKELRLAPPTGVLSAEVPWVWDLAKTGISPDDKYEFYVEVFDNDVVSGPKSARTATLSVRLPSLDELFEKAQDLQELAVKEMEKMVKESDEIRKEMQELGREMAQKKLNPEMDWKQQKRVEDVLKKQEEFRQKVENLRQQIDQMTQQLQQNSAISPETVKQYQELQQLMKQVDAPELRAQAQKMQEMLQSVSPREMQQAMQNFEFNEEQFKNSIERTKNLLQRIQTQQKTDELARRAKELEKQQRELEQQAKETNPSDASKRQELAQKQEQLKQEAQRLEQEMQKLAEMMRELGDKSPQEEMKQAMEQMEKANLDKQMQDAANEMKKGDMKSAQQKQQQARNDLQKFAQQMQKMKDAMANNSKKEAEQQMRAGLKDVLDLSKKQEDLKKQTQTLDPNSAEFRELAREQANIQQGLQQVMSNMMQMAQKSFSVTPEMARQLSQAMQQMQQSAGNLTERQAQQSGQAQSQAMDAMNKSAQQMQSALAKMQGQGKGDGDGQGEDGEGQGQGMMQRMQQMAMQQQMINQQLQQMMQGQGGQGGKGGEGQGEQMERLTQKQSGLQKSMQEMAKEQKESGGQKKTLGSLDQMANEMQEIVSDMRSGSITDETLRRQEKILSRMLDATRSMRERDWEKTREGNSAKEVAVKSPDQLDLSTEEGRREAIEQLLRSMKQGYTKDYEKLIRSYFEELQKAGVSSR